jgi:CheY-like chemotaxis protein
MKTINKILIAEDELLIAKVLRMQLEAAGYIVRNIVDGNEVIQEVTQWNPDLIIMDNYLKNNTSGIEAAQNIRDHKVEVPIIFATGNSFENTINSTNHLKNTVVLSKPIVFEQLLKVIEEFS